MLDSEFETLILDLDMLGRDARRGEAEYTTLLPYRTEDVRNLMLRVVSAMQELLKARKDYLSKLDTVINALTTNRE